MKAKSLALALALLWATGAGAAQDFDGSTGLAESATLEVSAVPFSVCAWVRPDNTTAIMMVFSISDVASDTRFFYLALRGDVAGDPVRLNLELTGTNGFADTTAGFAADTWNHVCAVFATTTSRAVYLDGGNKGTSSVSVVPNALDVTTVGALHRLSITSGFFDGRIAEIGVWNAALTDDEVATLAKGFAPPCVRRASLVAYYPMIRDTTSLKDQFTAANNLTLAGTNAVADHPRIINCQ